MTISERIRLTRQQKDITQAELAKRANINLKTLSRYELGSSIPPANALQAIAETLGVTADYLLNDKNVEIKDRELFKKFEIIQDIDNESKTIINKFLDLIIRDYKTKQAYATF